MQNVNVKVLKGGVVIDAASELPASADEKKVLVDYGHRYRALVSAMRKRQYLPKHGSTKGAAAVARKRGW